MIYLTRERKTAFIRKIVDMPEKKLARFELNFEEKRETKFQ